MEYTAAPIRADLPRSSDRPLALVVVGTSWGAVDWILPVLDGMRERGIDIGVYFKSTQPMADAHRFSDLYEHLRGLAKFVLDPRMLVEASGRMARLEAIRRDARQEFCDGNRIKALLQSAVRIGLLPVGFYRSDRIKQRAAGALLRRYLKGQPVQWLLHDFSQTGDEEIAACFHDARRFLFPHGSNWWDSSSRLPPERHRAMAAIDRQSTWMTGFPSDAAFYRAHGYRGDIVAVGQPKYDPSWIARMSDSKKPSRCFAADRFGRPTVLVITRPLRKTNDADGVAAQTEQIIRSAALRDLNVWIKLHPHQRPDELHPILSRVDHPHVAWCDESVLSAAASADLVIAQPSSAVLDTVAVGIPTIEYFDYEGQNYVTFVKEEGKNTSPYRRAGIVEPANSPAELGLLLDKLIDDATFRKAVVNRQKRCLEGLLPEGGKCLPYALQVVLTGTPTVTSRPAEAA